MRISRKLKRKSFHRCVLVIFGITLITTALAGEMKTPFIDPMFEFTMEKDIVFAQGDVGHPEKTGEMEMTLDLYRPVATDEFPETLPAMIFVFGGGYKKGSKSIDYIRDLCEYYAQRGYVTAAISYRLFKHNPSVVKDPIPAPPGFSEYGRVVNAATLVLKPKIRVPTSANCLK